MLIKLQAGFREQGGLHDGLAGGAASLYLYFSG